MVDIKTNSPAFSGGKVQIADEVIASIAGTAAMEIDGVSFGSMTGYLNKNFSKIDSKKNFAKIIKVEYHDEQLEITANIFIKHGYKILETSKKVQENIKSEVETMTGIDVIIINVNVVGTTNDRD